MHAETETHFSISSLLDRKKEGGGKKFCWTPPPPNLLFTFHSLGIGIFLKCCRENYKIYLTIFSTILEWDFLPQFEVKFTKSKA